MDSLKLVFFTIILNFFNIGFTEESFKEYQKKVTKFSEDNLKKIKEDKEFEKEVLMDENLQHYHINFYLPHEFGGCGAAY